MRESEAGEFIEKGRVEKESPRLGIPKRRCQGSDLI
jgi:hypothetical protein